MKTRFGFVIAGICLAAASVAGSAFADEPTQAQKDQWAKDYQARLITDWPYLARYHADNAAMAPKPRSEARVVFMGDSITEGWFSQVPGYFTPGRIDRGISGQTTPQMLARFRQDVIDLNPDVVQIMAGTNDIAGNTGPTTDADTQANIMSMTELAQAHGIRVILASIPPADGFPWKPGLETGQHIVTLNAWLKDYAKRSGAVYADYWGALHEGLAFHAGWALDGVHPNVQGYAAMAKVADAAIAQAMSRPAPKPLVARP